MSHPFCIYYSMCWYHALRSVRQYAQTIQPAQTCHSLAFYSRELYKLYNKTLYTKLKNIYFYISKIIVKKCLFSDSFESDVKQDEWYYCQYWSFQRCWTYRKVGSLLSIKSVVPDLAMSKFPYILHSWTLKNATDAALLAWPQTWP